jgi:hypothetical protein
VTGYGAVWASVAIAIAGRFVAHWFILARLLPSKTTTMLGNGALFFEPPNFNRPFIKRISAFPYMYW